MQKLASIPGETWTRAIHHDRSSSSGYPGAHRRVWDEGKYEAPGLNVALGRNEDAERSELAGDETDEKGTSTPPFLSVTDPCQSNSLRRLRQFAVLKKVRSFFF